MEISGKFKELLIKSFREILREILKPILEEFWRKFSQILIKFFLPFQSHENPFICSFCAKPFNHKKTLAFHESTHRASLQDRKQFSCHECGLKFITMQTLSNHIGQKHKQEVQATCPVADCKKQFFTRKAMQEHQRTHRNKIFECSQCEFKTKTKSNLNSHMDTHCNEEKYACVECDLKFASMRKMKSHAMGEILNF